MSGSLLELVALAAGFLLLAKGADWLVEGGSELARRMGVRPLVVGLTIVAWGTSAPEVVVSCIAARDDRPTIALGNVLGSNVANIGLVLGACACILPAVLQRGLGLRESLWLLLSLGALWLGLADGGLGRAEGLALLAVFGLYNLHLVLTARREIAALAHEPRSRSPWRDVLLGSIGVAAGAELAVSGAIGLATRIGIEERVIGLTIVAVGTSLPELAAGIGAAIKGESEISVGNVIGSNVFNVLAVMGLVGLVAPIDAGDAGVEQSIGSALALDFPVVLAFSLAAIALPYLARGRAGRPKAALLLGGWLLYTVLLFG